MTPDEFRRFGHTLIDWIADYHTRVEAMPVRSPAAPGEVRARLPPTAPAEPEALTGVLRDVDEVILRGLTHWQHPSFFGYFPSSTSPASVLGDFLSSGLGVLGVSWQSSPALTELEEVVCDWTRQMFGLPDSFRGVIQDTASTSTLVALLCARERSSGYSLASGGLQAGERPLVVYMSEHGHSSIEKAALLAGFGRDNLRTIPVDARHAMRADALDDAIRGDLARGALPCAVVATTGTTTTTALDPIDDIAQVARRHGVWLHVDAAMAGAAMALPECRWMWRGVEAADSVVVNAHKWLGAAFDCSLYYVRDPEHLIRVMSTNPSYLQSSVDEQVTNLRDWGIPLGRRFRALKLWFLLRGEGVSGIQRRLRRDMENARWLAEQVLSRPRWRVLAPVVLQTVCVRHEPPGLDADALDRHTLAWAERLNRSGEVYVTPAKLDGRWMVRLAIGSYPTERAQVEALWEAMQRAAESMPGDAEHPRPDRPAV
ncbi:MAG: aminotransferase class V-fold PLP-dependent enzyme [Deltaproteobacteria bacterium]|nr:aminotransferase class V-fold PLP-dependent enzyme [Myxococcales bacterium]MDP3215117.1 aminotransferase class V-fold PLP-dependent enzyme [Deltaproteobacteria bacterium]